MIKTIFETDGTCLKVFDVEAKEWITDPKDSYTSYQDAANHLGINHRAIRYSTEKKTHVFSERLQKTVCFRIKKIEQLTQAA
jgi:hypothetical protein